MVTDTVGLVLEANYENDNVKFEEEIDLWEGDSTSGNMINILAGITAFIH